MTLKEIVTLPYPAKISHTVDLGDLEVRDCEYSDDEITLLEE